MPASDSPALLVARFLKANHYNETLDAFISEAGLPPDSGTVEKGDLTIEKVLEEKKIFDLSLSFEKIHAGDIDKGWSLPAPALPTLVSSLPSTTNLLHVSVETFESHESRRPSQMLVATTADRRLAFLALEANFTIFKSTSQVHDSPILSIVRFGTNGMITLSTSMSGQVVMFDHHLNKTIDVRYDHKKYVVKVVTCYAGDITWIATAGWDAKVFLYQTTAGQASGLGHPVASIALPTSPEALLFLSHHDSGLPILLVTRRDSTFLHYYKIPSSHELNQTSSRPLELTLLGRQNLAPHSNAWIAFSPSSLAVCPTDSDLLAIATSAMPHMKLIIVRIIYPPLESPTAPAAELSTQTAQAQANLIVQDNEDSAIQIHVSTLASQTPYSTPQVVWRPDGTGVWVNGDDGVLRGIEAKTGKIIATLRDGHEAGSKIRSIWSGLVDADGEGRQEILVSGGFDRRLIVWRSNSATIS